VVPTSRGDPWPIHGSRMETAPTMPPTGQLSRLEARLALEAALEARFPRLMRQKAHHCWESDRCVGCDRVLDVLRSVCGANYTD